MFAAHLRGRVTQRRAAEAQQGLIDALLLTQLVALLIPDPFLQNTQTPLALHLVLDRETETNQCRVFSNYNIHWLKTCLFEHYRMYTILPSTCHPLVIC